MMSRTLFGALLVGLVFATAAAEPPAPPARMRFFDCAVVQFFGEACRPATDKTLASPTPGREAAGSISMLPPTKPLPLLSNNTPADAATPQEPLFTPATVSPDTPPLLLHLLQEPTQANARAFLAWYQARLARIEQVQALIDAMAPMATTPGQASASLERPERDTPTPSVSLDQGTPGHPQEQP